MYPDVCQGKQKNCKMDIYPNKISQLLKFLVGSHGSWIYNYLCYQCISPLMLWVRIPIKARCYTLC